MQLELNDLRKTYLLPAPRTALRSAAFLAICRSSRDCTTAILGGAFLPTWLP